MASDIIDLMLQVLVDKDIFHGIPKWELLKDYLVRQCWMAPDRLEERRTEIVQKFVRCKREQLEKAVPDLLGMTSNNTSSASLDRVSTNKSTPQSASQGNRTDQANDTGSNEKEGEGEEEEVVDEEVIESTVHPEIDEELSINTAQSDGLHSERTCFMSIFLPNGKWEGAALKYCEQDKSFVSLKIIERHKLQNEISKRGRIKLTWRLCSKEETDVTQFTVHKRLSCDFMLGKRCFDEEFNRSDSSEDDDDAESGSSLSKYTESMESPLPQMYSLPSPDPTEFAELVGIANAKSIEAMMRKAAISQAGSQTRGRGRRHARDIQSAPSQVPSSRRPRQPKGSHTDIAVEPHSAKRRNSQR